MQMSRAERRSKPRKPTTQRIPRTRMELLPLNTDFIRRASLVNHLAIETLRAGVGAAFHLTLIDEAIFLAREFRREGYGVAREGLIETAVDAYVQSTTPDESGAYRADDAACAVFGDVVTLLDRQFECIPAHVMRTVNARLVQTRETLIGNA
jgi:hypothetical protein